MMTLAAVLCCAMISTIFTACSKSENESISDYAAYAVKVYAGSSINTNCDDVVEQMKEALDKGMDGKMSGSTEDDKCICKRNDQKAISICDEAFQKANRSGHFSIVLQVTPFGNGLNNKTTDLKLYEN
ncbi:MAG: hypothetical protein IKQ25_13160 [Lachnospiraceae bacterium]|nr:hypothetical protein [Lachnospiraceae bacterium]